MNLMNEAEVIKVGYDIMSQILQSSNFVIKINHTSMVDTLLEKLKIKQEKFLKIISEK